MPRISRIHLAGIGHRDARFPSLTLDFRGPDGEPVDSLIWAENGTGKSSLFTLFFSTYQTNRRQFLGARGVAKARDLEDYVGERDLSFIITEWDITDGHSSASLLADEPRDLLVVGQVLSWKRLDRSSGDLRRLFFTLRSNRNIGFNDLPVTGLSTPCKSFEAFRDWLIAKAREYPKLQVVYETNQTDWKSHLEACHLDPELFAYQLRMNLDEGGVNELFNDLKETKDFIRLFLELGLDPEMPGKVRANLSEFLPQHRRLEAMRTQLAFNERLLIELRLFWDQVVRLREVQGRLAEVTTDAAMMLAALNKAHAIADSDVAALKGQASATDIQERSLESQREGLRRRLKFFVFRRAEANVREAEADLRASQEHLTATARQVGVVSLAELLSEIHNLEGEALEVQRAIDREQEQARPERAALMYLGSQYRYSIGRERQKAEEYWKSVQTERSSCRIKQRESHQSQIQFEKQKSTAIAVLEELENFFTERERQRDRLRICKYLEPKEDAGVALERWRSASSLHAKLEARNKGERDAVVAEMGLLAERRRALAAKAVEAESKLKEISKRIEDAESQEADIATHPEMQAAVEIGRADLNMPATVERLRHRVITLLNQLLRCSAGMAEDERAEKHVDRDGLFPMSRDVEAILEQFHAQGVSSALPAAHWLAANVIDMGEATRLLISDPAFFQGIFFNSFVDEGRIDAAMMNAMAAHSPVVVSPMPEDMPQQLASPRRVVPPQHAGAYNRDVAQEQLELLRARLETTRQDLNRMRDQYKTALELDAKLFAWIGEFGDGKLITMREKRHGMQQDLLNLREAERSAKEQTEAKSILSAELETQEREHGRRRSEADVACASIDAFLSQFDAHFEIKRRDQDAHRQEFQAAEKNLGALVDAKRQLDELEEELEQTEALARDAVQALQSELSAIQYAGESEVPVDEPRVSLRQRYNEEVRRFEGRFKNSTAQGQLEEKQRQIEKLNQRTHSNEFHSVSKQLAKDMALGGHLQVVRFEADRQHESAKTARTTAELQLKQARDECGNLSIPGKDEKPLQGELVPERSADLKTKVEELQVNTSDVESQLQQIRDKKSRLKQAVDECGRRAERFENLAKILINLNVVAALTDEIPLLVGEGDGAKVDKLCSELRDARERTGEQQSRLSERYNGIQRVVQDEEFSRNVLIPARTLFASLSLSELLQDNVAVERERAVQEQTETLKAELEQMQQHRDLIVRELLGEAEKSISLLRRAERLSRLPETVGEWSGEPFLRIHLHAPHSEDEKIRRLQAYVEELLSIGNMPDGVRLVFNALVALVSEKGMEATILKPETQRRRQRYGVREMSSWSEGERTTVAIILYCTLVKLRTQSRGVADRRAEVSALLLDNPIGKASKPEFLEMHRWIAGALGVQLIYATGINDPQALSVFPNRIRLAKNRVIPQTRELAVGIIEEDVNSIVTDIRIFDGADEKPRSKQAAKS